jgi:hypothetical protein
MAVITANAISLLGINIQGDIGPWTCYRNFRRGTVVFLRAPPKEPASELQAMLRLKWSRISRLWKGLDQVDRNKWNKVAKDNNLRISGYNLFVWHHCKKDYGLLKTLMTKSKISLSPI